MIAFGICVGSQERFDRCARPGLDRAGEDDSIIELVSTDDSIFSAYNEVLDRVASRSDLEALVLLHEDTEILDTDFAGKIRRRLAEPDIAIVGVIGAQSVKGIGWWNGEARGSVAFRHGVMTPDRGLHDVDVVDGLLLVLSPWAVRNLRFDNVRFSGFDGYDADLCFQAREAGRRVVVDDISVLHHTAAGAADTTSYRTADAVFRDKWGLVPDTSVSEQRASAEGELSPAVREFGALYYRDFEQTWGNTQWMGVRVLKLPLDLWIFQEIIYETAPELLIETGSASGGSALFYANLFDVLGQGEVLTIDRDASQLHERVRDHGRISFLEGDSTDLTIVSRARDSARDKRTMVVLDSDHSAAHVRRELDAYAPLVSNECYLIVEDTNASEMQPSMHDGPGEAVAAWLAGRSDFETDRSREKFMFTFQPRGYLRRVSDSARGAIEPVHPEVGWQASQLASSDDDLAQEVRRLRRQASTAERYRHKAEINRDLAERRSDRRERQKKAEANRYLELLKQSLAGGLGHAQYTRLPRPRGVLESALFDRLRDLGLELVEADNEQKFQEGLAWPLTAETMVGIKRLDNVRACIDRVIADQVPGDVIETGVWRGGTTIYMRAILRARGVRDRRVWVADSFEGLPPPNPDEYPADAGSRFHLQPDLAVSLDAVKANFERYGLLDDQVQFVQGFFKDTMPTLGDERWAVIRLDGDLYESTIDVLTHLYPNLSVGGYVIVDDYGAVPACRQAVEDFRAANGIRSRIKEIDWTGVFWRRAD
jgi:O-methyltransferase